MTDNKIDNKIQRVVEELKIAQQSKNISYQEIVERTRANGEYVSLGTVKNVFGKETKHNHSYEHTILPIVRALSPEDKDNVDIVLLQARLDPKDEMLREKDKVIAELRQRLENKELRHKDRETTLLEQLEFCKEQIAFKDKQIKRFHENIDRKDAMLSKLLTKEEK